MKHLTISDCFVAVPVVGRAFARSGGSHNNDKQHSNLFNGISSARRITFVTDL
jgi:hypothetical protein